MEQITLDLVGPQNKLQVNYFVSGDVIFFIEVTYGQVW